MDMDGYNIDSTADPSLTANIKEQVGQTNQQMANGYAEGGIAAGRGLLNSTGSDDFNRGLSFGDKATTAAIKSRYDKQYQLSETKLKLDAIQGAQSDHLRNLTVATQAAGQEIELNKKKAELKWQKEQADKKARGAIVGTTLGIVGGVVGGIYSGGAGAGAGYAAGNAAGNAIGGS